MDAAETVCALIVAGVIVAIAAAGLARLGVRAPVSGWRHVRPAALHWTALGLGGVLSVLMAYVRLFVGSSRADAEHQMALLTGLIVVFGALTIATALSVRAIFRASIRWRGDRLEFATPDGVRKQRFADVAGVSPSALGAFRMHFTDGSAVSIDPYATTARDLIDAVAPPAMDESAPQP